MLVGVCLGIGHIGLVPEGHGRLVGGGILPLDDRIVVRFRPIDRGLLVTRGHLHVHLGRTDTALHLHCLAGAERESRKRASSTPPRDVG